jgi:hypothetical protein
VQSPINETAILKQQERQVPVRSKGHEVFGDLESAAVVAEVLGGISSMIRQEAQCCSVTAHGAGAENGTRFGMRSQICDRPRTDGEMEVLALKKLDCLPLVGSSTFYFSLTPTLTTFLPHQLLSSMEDEVAALVSFPSYRMQSPP